MSTSLIAALFVTVSYSNHLPPGLLSALCWVESHHKVNAVNQFDGGSASVGICQMKLDTARTLGFTGDEKELMKPEVNMTYAAKYLAKHIKRYDDDINKAVAAYNAGKCRLNAKGQIMNRKYVRKVIESWKENR